MILPRSNWSARAGSMVARGRVDFAVPERVDIPVLVGVDIPDLEIDGRLRGLGMYFLVTQGKCQQEEDLRVCRLVNR
jgi:hypothetical protein